MIDYTEDCPVALLFRCEGSVAPRAIVCAFPSVLFGLLLVCLEEWLPGFRSACGLDGLGASQIWSATTGSLMLLIAFRVKQAFSRFWEGTGLLHQMRGEWFDTVSNCVTFSIAAKNEKPEQVMRFRHTIVRMMSMAHGCALEEISGNQVLLDTIDMHGLDGNTLKHIKSCHEAYDFNKVEVILHLVQSLITYSLEQGILKIPAPICSRVFQTISRGFVNLLNAKKINDTRFPFPFVQLIVFLLIVVSFMTPLMLSEHVKSEVFIVIFTFVPVFSLFSLNYIAAELENPFGLDANDLPLTHFQDEMNSCLLLLLHDNTDVIPTTSAHCLTDFSQLFLEICPGRGGFGRGSISSMSSLEPESPRNKARLDNFVDVDGAMRRHWTDESVDACTARGTVSFDCKRSLGSDSSIHLEASLSALASARAPGDLSSTLERSIEPQEAVVVASGNPAELGRASLPLPARGIRADLAPEDARFDITDAGFDAKTGAAPATTRPVQSREARCEAPVLRQEDEAIDLPVQAVGPGGGEVLASPSIWF